MDWLTLGVLLGAEQHGACLVIDRGYTTPIREATRRAFLGGDWLDVPVRTRSSVGETPEPGPMLIDEYDTPIHSAYVHGYYDKMVEFFRAFLGAGLKDNPAMHKAVMTVWRGISDNFADRTEYL